MNFRFQYILPLLLIAALTLAINSCGGSGRIEIDQLNNMKKISISNGEKEYLLKSARLVLENTAAAPEKENFPNLFKSDTRAVFVTVMRPGKNALLAFGTGTGLFNATLSASEKLKTPAANEKIANLRIRIDLVDQTTDSKIYLVGDKLKITDRDLNGIIFYTNPPVALLPDEIIMRNVIDHKGQFYYKRFKSVIYDRNLKDSLLLNFKNGESVTYCRFTRISFMEDKDRKTMMPLLNGRKTKYGLDAKSLLDAAISGGEYLKSKINGQGKFIYKYYPNMEKVSDSYNLLRHAGTVYAMTELYEITGDEELLKKIKLAHKFLIARMSGPNPRDKALGADFIALIEPDGKEAKAGGAGLCIVAFAKYTTVTGDKQYLPLMQSLAKFIQHQTEENGHLIAKYYLNPTGTEKPFESIYYPGECVLALTRLYQIDNNKSWIETAEKLVDYMVYIRDKSLSIPQLPHDHWLSIGMADLHPLVKNNDHKNHVYNIGQSIWGMMRKDGPRADWVGSFYTPPRSTPSATRNEGTIALYFLAKSQADPTDKFYKTALTIGGFHRSMQLDEISAMYLKRPDMAIGGFVRSFVNPEIQIDYVQHNISALLGLWKIQLEKQGKIVDDYLLGKQKHMNKVEDKEVAPAA